MANDLNLKPLGNRVVLEPLEKQETTDSGLVLPDTAKKRPQEGTVLAIGPGRVTENGERVAIEGVDTGDTVVYPEYGGTEFKVAGKTYLIIDADSLLAVRK